MKKRGNRFLNFIIGGGFAIALIAVMFAPFFISKLSTNVAYSGFELLGKSEVSGDFISKVGALAWVYGILLVVYAGLVVVNLILNIRLIKWARKVVALIALVILIVLLFTGTSYSFLNVKLFELGWGFITSIILLAVLLVYEGLKDIIIFKK